MKKALQQLPYAYRVHWSEDDQAWVGTCLEFPSLSHLAANEDAAFGGIRALVRAIVADMRKQGEAPPSGLATQTYKGHVSLRVTPDRHRQLAMEAAEKHVSLNRLINSA